MRWVIAALALGLAACDGSMTLEGGAAAPGEGYTLEVHASDAAQMYLVTAPDGTRVGARAADGASALMDASGVQAFAAAAPIGPVGQEKLSISAPGFQLAINADEDADGDGGGSVSIDLGGRSIDVNAEEGGAAGDRAQVRIAGASEQDARDFITEADEISPAVQAQMLAALGLE